MARIKIFTALAFWQAVCPSGCVGKTGPAHQVRYFPKGLRQDQPPRCQNQQAH